MAEQAAEALSAGRAWLQRAAMLVSVWLEEPKLKPPKLKALRGPFLFGGG